MSDHGMTYCCIVCGDDFHPANIDIAICPKCGGPKEANGAAESGGTRPAGGVPGKEPAVPGEESPSAGEPVREWQTGDVILDLYEVKDIYTSGGMGLVYRARHRGWNMDLVIKSPRPGILARAGGSEAFIREAETWMELGLHPHIVTCHYVRTIEVAVSDYMKGKNGKFLARKTAGKQRRNLDQRRPGKADLGGDRCRVEPV
jgi:hypothetical protein